VHEIARNWALVGIGVHDFGQRFIPRILQTYGGSTFPSLHRPQAAHLRAHTSQLTKASPSPRKHGTIHNIQLKSLIMLFFILFCMIFCRELHPSVGGIP